METFDYSTELGGAEYRRRMDELVFQFLKERMDEYPKETLPVLRERVKKLKDYQIETLILTPTKKPILALILSLVAGAIGVDRFYIGDVGLGILKLITFGGLGIWTLVDYFTIMGRTKKKNLNELLGMLDKFEKENSPF